MDARVTPRVLVAGAGPVGLAAALALARAGHPVTVIDARSRGAGDDDPRAVALAHGSRLILERLGAWRRVSGTPIRTIEVSQAGGFGRARIEAGEHGIDALGHVVRLGMLGRALLAAAEDAGVAMRFDCPAGDAGAEADGICVDLPDAAYRAALLVRAEGSPGDAARIKDYGQTALVTEVWPRPPQEARAWERFTREGPLALLPLDTGFSVVWCMAPERATALAALDDEAFLAAFAAATRFTPYRWERIAARRPYPLALLRRQHDRLAREVSLGNAAQALHPVAGQGLNLGLRDAFELAACMVDGIDEAALARWRARRRADRDATITATDAYVSLFSNDIAPLRVSRGMGLAAVDLLPPLRAAIARRMMFGVR